MRAAFGSDRCDYAQIIKTYGTNMEASASLAARRYSPAVCTAATKVPVMGAPDMSKVSTSYVERNNLSIRQGMRRMLASRTGFLSQRSITLMPSPFTRCTSTTAVLMAR